MSGYLNEVIRKFLKKVNKYFLYIISAVIMSLFLSSTASAAESTGDSSSVSIVTFLIAGVILLVIITGYAVLVQKTDIGCKNCVCGALGRKPCDGESDDNVKSENNA
jgi:predicted Na+-dependent transporter